MRRKVDELKAAARRSSPRIDAMGGAVAAIDYMKRALVESNTERAAPDRGRRADRRRRQPLDRDGAVAAVRRRRLDRGGRSRHRGRADRAPAGLARGPRRQGRQGGAGRAASAPPREGRNVMEPSIACAKAGVTTGEWGAALRARVRRVPRADRRRPARGRGRATAASTTVRAEVERVSRQARPAHQAAGRQARPRRPLQRRRADRGARPRLRHGGRLRGHPPHARRRSCAPPLEEARARGRPVDPVGQPRAAGRRGAWSACARRASTTCRWWSAASSRRRTPRTLQGASASPPSTRRRTSSSTPSWRHRAAGGSGGQGGLR